MSKKKEKLTLTPKKNSPKTWYFLFGVIVGMGLFSIPLDSDFSPIKFQKKSWENSGSVFQNNMPTTIPILEKEGFVVAYNAEKRNPQWVYHKLTGAGHEQSSSRQNCDFKSDLLIPEHLRANIGDYSKSGLDRGHLCPAADCSSQKSIEDSFLLTNIAPQNPAFNRGYWKKLEGHVRDLAQTYHAVHVFSGPLYLSSKGRDGNRYVKYQVIGKNDVAVPTHFFMLIFVEKLDEKMLAKAYILPNKAIDHETPLKKFATTVDEIEKASGTLFTHILQ